MATAAFQIEGAAREDGRGLCIWDTYCHDTNGVLNSDNADVACDHYHRWEADLDLIVSLGMDAYRFSIAWPRLYPEGGGDLNQPGLDFYSKLIDGCVARKLKVFVTLYHWDLPQSLADVGGWANPDTATHFAQYAATVARVLGDRIDSLTTFNEPWCSSILSHLYGIHAPGKKDLDTTLAVIHGQHRAHGLAVQAIRAERPDIPVGIVLNAQAVRAASDSPEDTKAALRHHQFHNGLFMNPLFDGQYPAEVIEAIGDRFPEQWQNDLDTIHQPLDFWGLNYYTPEYVANDKRANTPFPASTLIKRPDVMRTDIGWEIDATGMNDVLQQLYSEYSLPPCYITENGAAFNQGVIDGVVDDQERINYLDAHLQVASQAISQGIPLLGYFAWSLMDNFEWAEGYSMRFGLIHVNYDTQERTLKNSAMWYREFVARHTAKRHKKDPSK